jgi:hypothetical protein
MKLIYILFYFSYSINATDYSSVVEKQSICESTHFISEFTMYVNMQRLTGILFNVTAKSVVIPLKGDVITFSNLRIGKKWV